MSTAFDGKGRPSGFSSDVRPAASRPTTVPTVTRSPRIHGVPSRVVRFRGSRQVLPDRVPHRITPDRARRASDGNGARSSVSTSDAGP